MARTIGTAAGTVYGGEAGNVGAVAERATGRVLSRLPARVAVLHDLNIPGSPANVDHAVVVGNVVWLFDSKAWQPGWYVTLAGRTWRKWRPWVNADGGRPADKLTLPMARDRLARQVGAGVEFRCRVVVHSSTKKGTVRTLFYRPKSAKAWTPERLQRWVESVPDVAPAAGLVERLHVFVRR